MFTFCHHYYVRDKFMSYKRKRIPIASNQVDINVPVYQYICLKCGKVKIK